MRIIWPAIFVITILTLLTSLDVAMLRYLNKAWWAKAWIRRIAVALPLAGLVSLSIWLVSFFTGIGWLAHIGSVLAVVVLIALLAFAISLPFSGIFNRLNVWFDRRLSRGSSSATADRSNGRRAFLRSTAAIFPIVAISAGGAGIARAFEDTRVYRLPARFDNLPGDLNGLKILHLSDSHLGIYRDLGDLESVISSAEPLNPDLVVFTGDIADDLELLPTALKMVDSLKPKYGSYASLGNHEYYRGVDTVIKSFERSSVILLRSAGLSINIDGAALYLAGADDPVTMRRDNSVFLRKTIESSLAGAPSDAFYLLMSHRPEGFDAAEELSVDLTLSGHTHGGQVGISGKSFWRTIMPNKYLWGSYSRGESQMYLTSGIGHWFPFRLGCPPEAPVIELISNKQAIDL
jgi:predicted MPP superfamily phosphohydrolase